MDEAKEDLTHKKSALSALAVYGERRSLVMLCLGFASGLPYLLIFDTLSLWLRDANVSLEVIGFFSLATLAYALTFLWAPLVDRVKLPVLFRLLGQRRSWILASQVVVTLGLWLMAGADPTKSLGTLAGFAVMVGFASATQDTAMNGWRIEASPTEKQGVMAAAYQWGYRVAQITAGAAPLVLAQFYNWHLSYFAMAALMAVGIGATLLAPREEAVTPRPVHVEGIKSAPALEFVEWLARGLVILIGALLTGSGLAASASLLAGALTALDLKPVADMATTAWTSPYGVYVQILSVLVGLGLIALAAVPLPGAKTRPGAYLSGALGEPLKDFLDRHKGMAATILALICFYRLSEFVLTVNGAFYLDLGFSKLEIAGVRKVYGVVMYSLGVGVGGFAIARLGLMRALVIGAFAQPLSHLGFAYLALKGHSMSAFLIAMGLDNVAATYAGTCLIAYMSSLTSAGFTATQYAMFSSLYALPGKLVSSQSGRLVEAMARDADKGGLLAPLKGLFAHLSPTTLAGAMQKSHVSPAALGVGYLSFFLYTAVIGIVGILLAFRVYALTQRAAAQTSP